jgi:hypothetical protein
MALFFLLTWVPAAAIAYVLGGLGPAVMAVIIVPFLVVPVLRAYARGIPAGPTAEDANKPLDALAHNRRRLIIFGLLMVMVGVVAAPTTEGPVRIAIVALTCGGGLWTVFVALYANRGS